MAHVYTTHRLHRRRRHAINRLITPLAAIAAALVTYHALTHRQGTPPQPTAIELPPFELGSLVTVDYEDGVYFVESYSHTKRHEDDGVYDEQFFDLTDAATGDSLIAFIEDMTPAASAAAADAYLAAMPANMPANSKEEPIMQPTAKINSAAPRKQALIDRLLEQRKQYSDLAAFFGGGYDGNLALIDEDLAQLSRLEMPSTRFMGEVELRIEQRINHRTYDAPLVGDAE